MGDNGQDGFLQLRNSSGARTIQLQGSNGGAFKTVSGDWAPISDSRVKKNIKPYKEGLEAIMKLNPINYEFNGEGGFEADGKNTCRLCCTRIGTTFFQIWFLTFNNPSPESSILPDPEKPGENLKSIESQKAEIKSNETEFLAVDSFCVRFMLINAVKELADRLEKLEKSP